MTNHVKAYMTAYSHNHGDVILCEVCGTVAVDVHHIIPRGMGGRKGANHPDNLIALCRTCHDKAHRHELSKEKLQAVHAKKQAKKHDNP
jgi:5-methylcytosine-specific restriction endonuclease McrA